MGRNRVFHFEEVGVKAYLHDDPELIVKHEATDRPTTPADSEFKPGRMIMNVALAYADPTKVYKNELNDYLILLVRFGKRDVDFAKTKKSEPVLLYWDGKTWIPIANKHEFTLYYDEGSDEKGIGVVKIEHWGDPWIAWGP